MTRAERMERALNAMLIKAEEIYVAKDYSKVYGARRGIVAVSVR